MLSHCAGSCKVRFFGELFPSPTSTSLVRPAGSASASASPSSPYSLSRRAVLQLVQSALTAQLHHFQPAPLPVSAHCSPSSTPLYRFLVHLASYHSLFVQPCQRCHDVTSYHDDTAKRVPAVQRSAATGHALHAACAHAMQADIPTAAAASATSTTGTATHTAAASTHSTHTHGGSNGAPTPQLAQAADSASSRGLASGGAAHSSAG